MELNRDTNAGFNRDGVGAARYPVFAVRWEDALVAFRKINGPRVILMSTKCGGVGLNLASANRVVK
jgi:hypothetical protein